MPRPRLRIREAAAPTIGVTWLTKGRGGGEAPPAGLLVRRLAAPRRQGGQLINEGKDLTR